ncbi:unnamed protein product [Chondrus crispus]|uniref:Uncharacterized protein n=1 Tax=Chondrus crispus TaxID=2769 RepID=R7Q8B6_CHOCR|nr:unnamed protein product [Chondrus crispus]CDF34028.1 unnamed protein product [Chondrus crispus]|eukprot:XP_005713847.1 unnamed protein product [Chondrus crispus]
MHATIPNPLFTNKPRRAVDSTTTTVYKAQNYNKSIFSQQLHNSNVLQKVECHNAGQLHSACCLTCRRGVLNE